MTLDYTTEYPDVLPRQPGPDRPSGRLPATGVRLTEQDGKSRCGVEPEFRAEEVRRERLVCV